jgi:hypothetical protein
MMSEELQTLIVVLFLMSVTFIMGFHAGTVTEQKKAIQAGVACYDATCDTGVRYGG